MGACLGKPSAETRTTTAQTKSLRIERECKETFRSDTSVIKLLLLGAGGSGKSTFFKQIITMFGDGFDEEERALYIPVIAENIITSMQTLIQMADELAETDPALDTAIRGTAIESKKYVAGLHVDEELTLAIAAHIRVLWSDKGIQNCYEISDSRFMIAEGAPYFFDKVEEIADSSFIPNNEDLFRVRLKTTGIVESNFVLDDQKFRLIDVGGQKNERRKWIHSFSGVTAVLFVVALNGYDQVCYEDVNKNRMLESLELFEETLQNRVFANTPFILFLNKKDLFEQIIAKVPLSKIFPDYKKGMDFKEGLDFIRQKFLDISKKLDRHLFVHVTCATDQENVRHVFADVKEYVLEQSLESVGFI